MRKRKHSTARKSPDRSRLVRVTHPFHPLTGKEFVLLDRRKAWGRETVFCDDGPGRLLGLPIGWTSLADADPFVVMAAGRSPLHFADLLRLVALIEGLEKKE